MVPHCLGHNLETAFLFEWTVKMGTLSLSLSLSSVPIRSKMIEPTVVIVHWEFSIPFCGREVIICIYTGGLSTGRIDASK